jgi:exonuclease SbcD
MKDLPAKPADAYRVLHTADWHLGKLLNDQSRDEEHERFLDWLLALATEASADAIIVAGDIFDSANPPQSALSRYYNFVSALNQQTGCSLVVVAGNHDSAALLEAPKQVLRTLNVHVKGVLEEDPADRILPLPNADNPRVAVALLPFLRDRDLRTAKPGETADEIRAQVIDGIKRRYEETVAAAVGLKCPLLATGHLTVAGTRPSDSERDIHIGGLGAVGPEIFPAPMRYVALGHLHRPQEARGHAHIRYAGSPIALSFSESTDTKEVRLLDIAGENISQHSVPIPVFRRLAQVHTSRQNLREDLDRFEADGGELRTWVEVIVEDAAPGDDLVELARTGAEGKDFDVLKVIRGGAAAPGGLVAGDMADDEAIGSLLDDPRLVFDHLLEAHDNISEEEKGLLRTAFAELRAMQEEGEVAG